MVASLIITYDAPAHKPTFLLILNTQLWRLLD